MPWVHETGRGVVVEGPLPGRRTVTLEGAAFSRWEDGSVYVTVGQNFVRLDAVEWCNVIAAMSRRGERHHEQLIEAVKLHG